MITQATPASTSQQEAATSRRWAVATFFGVLLVLALSVYPAITSSLWLDETGTFWAVKDGFREMVNRANWWTATSPAYYSTAWISTQILGLNEIALRLPSVVFSLITAVLLFFLARRWLNVELAAYVVLTFFSIKSVSFSVVDARPYAFGLMLLVLAWLAFLRWAEASSARWAALFCLSAAGVVYAHYLLALGLLPLALYVAFPCLPSGRVSLRRFAVLASISLLLLVPLAPQFRSVFNHRAALSWPPTATWTNLAMSLMHPWMLLCIVIGWAIRIGKGGKPWCLVWEGRLKFLPLLAWIIIPPAFLFSLEKLDATRLFDSRYYISKEPGTAILLVFLLSAIDHRRIIRVVLILLLTCSAVVNLYQNHHHSGQDWKGAVASLNQASAKSPGLPVIVVSGFIDSLRHDYWHDPSKHDILFAPLLVYPLLKEPYRLPFLPGPLAEEEFSQTIWPAIRDKEGIAVVWLPFSSSYGPWFAERLRLVGMRPAGVETFGKISIATFKRTMNK